MTIKQETGNQSLQLLTENVFDFISYWGESRYPDEDPWNILLALFFSVLYSNIVDRCDLESYMTKTLRGKAEYNFNRSKNDESVLHVIEQVADKNGLGVPKLVKEYFYGDLVFINYSASQPIAVQDIKELADFLEICYHLLTFRDLSG
jgi:hypothetical protein